MKMFIDGIWDGLGLIGCATVGGVVALCTMLFTGG
jgi:hypothetical protein